MRLVNVRTYELEEFFGEAIPKYAILSHTWVAGEEVTFQEFPDQKEKAKNGARTKSGWDKIENTAQLAREDNHEHMWIDTCCIDKTSSAELTEAINSMMSWYEKSRVCYTYLEDVPSGLLQYEREDAFRECRWFTRGWTLQELLAPSKLIFIFADWQRFATRDETASLVSSITGIDTVFLHTLERRNNDESLANNTSMPLGRSSRTRLNSASIAQRMSWASRRRTTRAEDIAYCLLGIFDVNMPLLYGEGYKAFLRLQEQILMNSDDQSILAWNFEGFETEHTGEDGGSWISDYHRGRRWHHRPTFAGLLATSPSAFSTCQNIARVNIGNSTPHWLRTSRGLRLELPLGNSSDYPCAFLQCQDKYAPASIVALPLKPTREGFYVRARIPLKLVDYRLLLSSRPTEFYALEYGRYTMRQEMDEGYSVSLGNLPKDMKVLRSWTESGNMGPYSQIIIESDGRDEKWFRGALLLGGRSDKVQLVLVVESRLQESRATEVKCGLIEPNRSDVLLLAWWDSSRPGVRRSQRSHQFSEELRGMMRKAEPSIQTADGVYSTFATVSESVGESLIFIDINIRSRPFYSTIKLSRQIQLWFRNHMRGHEGINRIILLLILVPRVFTIVVRYWVRKSANDPELAANPWFVLPLMMSYAILTAGDPPRFLTSVLKEAREKPSETLKDWAITSCITYFGCKLLWSDEVLERFKKLLAQ